MAVTRTNLRRSVVLRAGVLLVAVLCIIAGAITLPLPIPTGVILLGIGFALILLVSRRSRVWFRGYRRRTPWIDARLGQIEHRLPDVLRQALSGRRRHPQS
ncbi:MAG: hypothetical protein AAFQ42_06900 [Pseudomonadota bacterium]